MTNAVVDLELYLKHETGGAILVAEDEDADAVWLPKSQVEVTARGRNRVIEVTLPEWLALERGLI